MNAWFGNYLFLVTKLESAYAVATIFDDSDFEGAEGGATSEIIDLVKNFILLFIFLWLVFNFITMC